MIEHTVSRMVSQYGASMAKWTHFVPRQNPWGSGRDRVCRCWPGAVHVLCTHLAKGQAAVVQRGNTGVSGRHVWSKPSTLLPILGGNSSCPSVVSHVWVSS
jgi:hypothetical protein